MLTPKMAAERVGKSKATILRNIKDGKLSASRDDSGNYHIDLSELMRVYSVDAGDPPHEVVREALRGGSNDPGDAPEKRRDIEVLQVKLEAAHKTIEDRDRELVHRDRTIDDLRERLDKEGEERRRLTAMLTDQRPKADQKPAERPATRAGFWIALVVVVAVLAVVGAFLWLAPVVNA